MMSFVKVVNCYRALDEAKLLSTDDGNENKNPEPGGLTVLDVETFQETQEKSSETSAAVPEGSYVYDIYYTADGSDLSDVQIDHELSVYPMDSDLSSYLCADIDNSDSEAPDDEDDSNDENNWRNDYPDEEDFSSDEDGREISGMKLCSNFNSLKIGSDDEDDADEYLDYPDDYDDSPREMSSDEDLYSGNLSPSDVCNFGESYAKYKAKVKSEYDSSCSVKSDDESQE
ncbi:hypothetical protein LSTR_LSTR009895 [Laodelphax striatellus]|uniref:Probable RNA polymerase II nuclear localization protein SLC7A6OS n=1 Tax=Laodelphax striatellus TaxID=195883 RepID=A0A482WL15_LAOST|nr:hypothetical protein LSTR_LSTR009895 [Laodelphax striatellus]